MDSGEGLFPDDVRFRGFYECAEYKDDMKEIMDFWGQISTTYSSCFQVHICSVQWIPMVEAFIRKWGMYSVPADIKRYFVIVEEEQPIFMAQYNERVRKVEVIRNHHEWIESPNHLFP